MYLVDKLPETLDNTDYLEQEVFTTYTWSDKVKTLWKRYSSSLPNETIIKIYDGYLHGISGDGSISQEEIEVITLMAQNEIIKERYLR
jgi:hypothetical protein